MHKKVPSNLRGYATTLRNGVKKNHSYNNGRKWMIQTYDHYTNDIQN